MGRPAVADAHRRVDEPELVAKAAAGVEVIQGAHSSALQSVI